MFNCFPVYYRSSILMAENAEGELSFMSPEKDFEAGSEIR
jgi:hypothetical protein